MVAVFVTSTVTPGRTPPDESVTMPAMLPVACACAELGTSHTSAITVAIAIVNDLRTSCLLIYLPFAG